MKKAPRDEEGNVDIATWIKDRMDNMEDFEEHELVIWHVPERVAAANWIVRCLANPDLDGSEEVVQAIVNRREKILNARKQRDLEKLAKWEGR